MKAALYLRVGVGTSKQPKFYSAVENQKEMLMSLAKEQDLEVRNVYEDIGFSGLTFDRPALQALLRDAKECKMDTVLVCNLPRLGRDPFQTAKLVKELQESGVQVRTPYGVVDEAPYLSGLASQLMKQYQGQRKERWKQTGIVPGAAQNV